MLKKNTLISIIAFLILTIIIGLFLYKKNEKRETIKNNQPNKQEEEIKPKESLILLDGKCVDEETDSEGMIFYCISELGIKFKVDEIMKNDLIYEYEIINDEYGWKSIKISSKSLLQKDKNCSTDNRSLGSISIAEKDGENNDFPGAIILKKINNLFVLYNGPHSVCTSKNGDSETDKLQQLQLEKIKKYISDIQLIN